MGNRDLAHAATIASTDLDDPIAVASPARDNDLPELAAERYRVEEFIGAGAFGSVYRAVDERLQKPVAIKVLRSGRAVAEQVAERFRTEALAASRLNHPNIVNVTDFDVLADGRTFLVMEYVPGDTLESYLSRQAPLSLHRAVYLAVALCDALAEAHNNWVIHRDLKPANVIVGDRQSSHIVVKILDFGVAKLVEADGGARATAAGGLVGTPAYMAPEQIRGDATDIDGRVDIYAVGTVLYEMLTGRVPFDEDNVAAQLQAQLDSKPIPPSRIRPDIPRGLEQIVLRALEKDPTKRFQAAEDMARALRSFLAGATPSRPSRRSYRRALVATAVIALAAGIAGNYISSGPAHPATSQQATPERSVEPAPMASAPTTTVEAAPEPATEPTAALAVEANDDAASNVTSPRTDDAPVVPKRRRRVAKKRDSTRRHVPDAPLPTLRNR